MIVLNKKLKKLEASGPNGYHRLPFNTGCGDLIISAIIITILLLGIKYNII
jgi:hypothetical protein